MSIETDDKGLLSEPIPALVQVIRDRIAAIGNDDYKPITVSAADGRISQTDVEELGADTPHLFVSMVGFGGIDGGCIEQLDYAINIEVMAFGGGCGGKTKHQWAKLMMTLATQIILKHGGDADLTIIRDTFTGVSLDTTQSRLAGLGVWSLTFQALTIIDLSGV